MSKKINIENFSILCFTFIVVILMLVIAFIIKTTYNHSNELVKHLTRIENLEKKINEIKVKRVVKKVDPKIIKAFKRIKQRKKLEVLATAYNSIPNQTDSTPFEAAWGDTLKEGMRIIAVSRDLEKNYGLTRGKYVDIEGLGRYMVLDRMHHRKRNQIDIYMGTDLKSAINFGVKTLEVILINNIDHSSS